MTAFTSEQLTFLANIRAKLTEYSYTQSFLTSLSINPLPTNFFNFIKASLVLKNRNILTQLLYNIFFFGRTLSQDEIAQLFTVDEVALLEKCKVVQRVKSHTFRSTSMIIPFQDLYIFTDFLYRLGDNNEVLEQRTRIPHFVFTPTIETVQFFNEIKHNKMGSFLDMGTGCGMLALLASPFNKKIVGVDCNARAVRYASFNCLFNQIENVEFKVSDGFTSIDERFDVIVSNTPHEIHYKKMDASTFGGKTGVEFMLYMIGNVQKYLTKNGRVFLETAITGKQALTTLRREAVKNGFHSRFKKIFSFRIEDYVMGHSMDMMLDDVSKFTAESEQYLSSCHKKNIDSITCGVLSLTKKSED